jgi:hypothetical protein
MLQSAWTRKSQPVRSRCVGLLFANSLRTYILSAVVVCLALWGLTNISQPFQLSEATLSETHTACWCGASDAEAVAMGCRYDHLAVDWLPDSCIDDELVKEFDQAGPGLNGSWPYFVFDSGNSMLSIELADVDSLALNGKDYWTTREWHVAHCLFTWRKQFRMRYNSQAMEPWNTHESHIIHCTKYIMDLVKANARLNDIETHILGANRHPNTEA